MSEEEKTEKLPFKEEGKKPEEKKGDETKVESEKKFEKPPHLRRVISVSCSMPARDFIRLMKENKVTAVLDTRVGRRYRGYGFYTLEDDFRFICELAGIEYIVVESLSPTQKIRNALHEDAELRASDRDPYAWTKFLEGYEAILKDRRPFRSPPLTEVIQSNHEAVAVVCACAHHEDCHRSLACGLMANLLPEVELKVVYPGKKPPARKSPRRYRLKAFPWADLNIEKPGGRK